MDKLLVRMDEWFFTQGLIGYKAILENYGERVETTPEGIIVEKKHLEILADAYFSYYLNEYSVAEREERILRRLHKQFKEGESSVKRDLNTRLNNTKNSINRYFKDTNEGKQLNKVTDLYRKEKKYSKEMDKWLDTFIEMLHTKEINEKLTANFFKAVHLRPYFGQASLLNVTHNRKSIPELKEIFHRDFITPILEEWKLLNALTKNEEESIVNVLDESVHNSFGPIRRGFRNKSIEEMKNFLKQEIHKCSLTDFPIALLSFEERVFSPLVLSMGNALNMTWDAHGKNFLPICSLARLLIFCSQAGATISQGKSVFIFYGGSFDEIYQTNRSYTHLRSYDRTFDEIIFDLIREQQVRADYTKKHYMIYEYESDYQSKKTLLDYMIMTPNLVKLFSVHNNLFHHVHYTTKSTMIRLLLQKIDPKQFITTLLASKIKNSYSPFEVIQMIQVRHLNQMYLKEVINMDSNKQKRYVWALFKSAEEVKHKIGESKAQGIAYRLLNAIRSNNRNTFMDTVMRTYISSDLEMPGLLLEVLHEEQMDFATVGNAWVAGLVSKPNDLKKGEEVNE